ncbi:septum formation initiator family protein [Citricoccus sp. GCM10030269]|uniref:FtsB family cell division protein n=1 Tax=Citricoccus sp. GCM10030269 TaxID=3273388 RepID=UPI003607C9D1
MATRRPRVPKTSQRQLVDVGTGFSTGTGTSAGAVGGHSAKIIPLDAAPSRHSEATRDPAPEAVRPEAARPDVSGPESSPAGAGSASSAPSPAPAPAPSPEQRRAAERRELLHRSKQRPPRAPSSPRSRKAGTADATGTTSAAAGTGPASTRAKGAAGTTSTGKATPAGKAGASTAEPEAPVAVEPVPARHFTGRSIAFLIVLFVAATLLAPTLRVFLDQQAELRTVREDIAAEQQLQKELTGEIARWDDPAYIQQQARERFNLVMPGERTYMVVGGDETVEDPVPPPASPSEVNQDLPWADALWDSVVRAGTD